MPAQCNQFSNESRHHVHPLPYFPLTCLRLPSIHLLCCARGQHPCICRKTYSSTSGSCSAGASRHASGPRSSEMRSIQGMHMGLKQVIDCSPLELMFTVLGWAWHLQRCSLSNSGSTTLGYHSLCAHRWVWGKHGGSAHQHKLHNSVPRQRNAARDAARASSQQACSVLHRCPAVATHSVLNAWVRRAGSKGFKGMSTVSARRLQLLTWYSLLLTRRSWSPWSWSSPKVAACTCLLCSTVCVRHARQQLAMYVPRHSYISVLHTASSWGASLLW